MEFYSVIPMQHQIVDIDTEDRFDSDKQLISNL